MAITTALNWAVLAIVLKFSLHTLPLGSVVWARMALAFVLLAVIFLWHRPGALRILYHPPWLGLIAAAGIACNYFGFMKGVELTGASNAQIMIQIAPLSFAVVSVFIFREIPTRLQLAGLLIAAAGFGFFYWDQMLVSMRELGRFQGGNLWLILAAMTWTLYAVLQKKLLKFHRPQELNLLIYGASALLLLPSAELGHLFNMPHFGWIEVGVLAFLALNTVVAYGALTEALARIPAREVSVILAMNPLLTLAIMAYLARAKVAWISAEPIAWRGLLGAFLVVAGVILTVSARPRTL
jgi:drug/metabolite transporter (DMT)-like permease